jgi:hypothetical protein
MGERGRRISTDEEDRFMAATKRQEGYKADFAEEGIVAATRGQPIGVAGGQGISRVADDDVQGGGTAEAVEEIGDLFLIDQAHSSH